MCPNHLQWMYDRMVNVYKEDPQFDYMIAFKRIIENLNKA